MNIVLGTTIIQTTPSFWLKESRRILKPKQQKTHEMEGSTVEDACKQPTRQAWKHKIKLQKTMFHGRQGNIFVKNISSSGAPPNVTMSQVTKRQDKKETTSLSTQWREKTKRWKFLQGALPDVTPIFLAEVEKQTEREKQTTKNAGTHPVFTVMITTHNSKLNAWWRATLYQEAISFQMM